MAVGPIHRSKSRSVLTRVMSLAIQLWHFRCSKHHEKRVETIFFRPRETRTRASSVRPPSAAGLAPPRWLERARKASVSWLSCQIRCAFRRFARLPKLNCPYVNAHPTCLSLIISSRARMVFSASRSLRALRARSKGKRSTCHSSPSCFHTSSILFTRFYNIIIYYIPATPVG